MAEFIEREALLIGLKRRERLMVGDKTVSIDAIISFIENRPAADVAPVVHGRWEIRGGDLHSSGYAIYCSVCDKTHFVHYKYSLGGMYGCKELFEKPKHCPSCGAFMEFEE